MSIIEPFWAKRTNHNMWSCYPFFHEGPLPDFKDRIVSECELA